MCIPPNITDHPAVLGLALRTDSSRFSVLGRLKAIWDWVGLYGQSGRIAASRAVVDALVEQPGFSAALEAEGLAAWSPIDQMELLVWIDERVDSDGVRVSSRERSRRYRERKASRERVTERDASRDARVTRDAQCDEPGKIAVPSVRSTTYAYRHANCSRAHAGAPGSLIPAAAALKQRNPPGAAEARATQSPASSPVPDASKIPEAAGDLPPSPTPDGGRESTPVPREIERQAVERLLTSAGVRPDVVHRICQSPRGTLRRVRWAMEETPKRLARARRRGERVRSPAAYIEFMVCEADNGPDARHPAIDRPRWERENQDRERLRQDRHSAARRAAGGEPC